MVFTVVVAVLTRAVRGVPCYVEVACNFFSELLIRSFHMPECTLGYCAGCANVAARQLHLFVIFARKVNTQNKPNVRHFAATGMIFSSSTLVRRR